MSVPAAYLGVILIWSTTPLAIKWSNEIGGFLFAVMGRMLLSAIICLIIMVIFRIPLPCNRQARYSYLAVSLVIYGSMSMTYWGAQFIPSGLVSVLFGLSPIITSIVAVIWLKEHVFSTGKLLGMLLGIIGLIVIFNNELHMNLESTKGIIAILAGVFLYSISSTWVKSINAEISPLAITCGGLLVALPLYGITWLILQTPIPTVFPLRAILSISYLSIFGSVIGFILFYYILKYIDPPRIALVTLITPVMALWLGQMFNHETIHITVWIGSLLILTGLSLYQWGDLVFRSFQKQTC